MVPTAHAGTGRAAAVARYRDQVRRSDTVASGLIAASAARRRPSRPFAGAARRWSGSSPARWSWRRAPTALAALDDLAPGFWVGWCSFELGHAAERVVARGASRETPSVPDVVFARFDALAVVDEGGAVTLRGDGPVGRSSSTRCARPTTGRRAPRRSRAARWHDEPRARRVPRPRRDHPRAAARRRVLPGEPHPPAHLRPARSTRSRCTRRSRTRIRRPTRRCCISRPSGRAPRWSRRRPSATCADAARWSRPARSRAPRPRARSSWPAPRTTPRT